MYGIHILLLYGAISVTLQQQYYVVVADKIPVVRMFYSCKIFIPRACDRFFKFTIVVLVQICPEAHSCVHLVIYIYAKLGLQASIILVRTSGCTINGKPVFLN